MNDATHGRLLIADADYEVLGGLARTLRERGHHVVLATDGRTGLQRAVEIAADVVLVDRDIPGLDVRTFLELLRDNPRTSAARIFLLGRGDVTTLLAIDGRAEPLVKPFNAAEVAARIEELLRARRSATDEQELRGDLGQVTLFDLLQVFKANFRTGRLHVRATAVAGDVFVRDGAVVDATAGKVVGEKALYRLLAVQHGTFVYTPGMEADHRRIGAPTEELLMESVRRTDEIARLREALPPKGALYSARDPAVALLGGVVGVLATLDEPRTLDEILDLSPDDDLSLLGEIERLLAEGAIEASDGERPRLFSEEEAVVFRTAALKLRRAGLEGPPRIGILARLGTDIVRFARALAQLDEFVPAPEPPVPSGLGAFGSLGALRIGGAELELFALPMDPPLRPLYGPALAGSTVALALLDEPVPGDIEELCELYDVAVVRAGAALDKPAGAARALRTALAHGTAESTPSRLR